MGQITNNAQKNIGKTWRQQKVTKEKPVKEKDTKVKTARAKTAGKKSTKKVVTEDTAAKGKLALEVIERLEKEYPDADCTLDYDQAWKLLVSVRLAAQCTDVRVNVVVEDLYAQYPDVNALAKAEPEEIEKIVRPCGLGKSKARDISACMKMIKEEYDGKVPDDFDALMKLPGVGRKSANLIMGDVFGKPAIVTDTHCIRLTNRIGLVDGIKDPKKVEMALWKIVPPEQGSEFCHRLVFHGREVCTARTKPYCDRCCLADICQKNGVEA
ncbi:MAG: endonuclease III [Clostridia bacterium]|nr:endonuclease III [Clostridia bacterium]